MSKLAKVFFTNVLEFNKIRNERKFNKISPPRLPFKKLTQSSKLLSHDTMCSMEENKNAKADKRSARFTLCRSRFRFLIVYESIIGRADKRGALYLISGRQLEGNVFVSTPPRRRGGEGGGGGGRRILWQPSTR